MPCVRGAWPSGYRQNLPSPADRAYGEGVATIDLRTEIKEFLSSRRARITPERAGLPAYGGNRRVKGLRREEVALLAGVSVDYYVRMERGRLAGASDGVLDALASALQLDEAERDHLFHLARQSRAPSVGRPIPGQQPSSTCAAPPHHRKTTHSILTALDQNKPPRSPLERWCAAGGGGWPCRAERRRRRSADAVRGGGGHPGEQPRRPERLPGRTRRAGTGRPLGEGAGRRGGAPSLGDLRRTDGSRLPTAFSPSRLKHPSPLRDGGRRRGGGGSRRPCLHWTRSRLWARGVGRAARQSGRPLSRDAAAPDCDFE